MRPRVLYVPIFAGFEARPFTKLAGEWADVETFDGPGIGTRAGEPVGGPAGVAAAGAARLDELGWERCVVACDSHAQAAGIELAVRDPRVGGIAVSHPAPDYSTTGERPALSEAIFTAGAQLLATDYRSFARALTQLTQGTLDDEWVEGLIATVPHAVAQEHMARIALEGELVPRLSGEDLEVLLAGHSGCLMWTPEGVEDAAAALPDAQVVHCDDVPMADEAYYAALRELCARVFG
ncbi:MAG TPA: hypothetical protein VF712_02855 [Thermoleophilaceae bacterium]